MVLQLVGFAIGVALLIWCIDKARSAGGWSQLRDADPKLIAGLIACTFLSYFVNGVAFWLVVKPVRDVGFGAMQWLNLVTGILNYAPVRLGMVARIAYHLRVDRMPFLQIMAWFMAITATLGLTLAACFVATFVYNSFDWIWALIVLAQRVFGGFLIASTAGFPIIAKHGRGMHQMLRHPLALWGAIGLRVLDIGAFAGRMACAVAIMGLAFTPSEILLLAFVTLAVSLNPLGKVGFREMAVAFVATRMVSTDADAGTIDDQLAQLALIESAGEAAFAIPLGAFALIWYWRRWTTAPRNNDAQIADDAQDSPA